MKRSNVWKKIVLLCFLLIFAATGTIFAGGSSETLTESDDPYINAVREKLQGTTITIASMSHTSSNAMREMVDEFTAETGIKVRWDIMEEGLLREKILMDHHAGTGTYDVLFLMHSIYRSIRPWMS